ncbi:hypothetical protein KAW96_01500 [candidate division WOR-3 bacterium]|nr:hypothetical protein [candidate division WOR-3 bacterium]
MADNDDFWGGIILGGLLGAGLAPPKQGEKSELQNYRNINQQYLFRKQKLGDLSIFEKLRNKPEIYNLFLESCNLFIYGFFRGASIFSIVVIENILREKYQDDNFKSLIDKAKKDKLIENVEEHYLNGLRLDRNSLVHNATRQINENESLMIIHLAIRIMKRLF